MKPVNWILLAGAFFSLSIAAKLADLGAPAPKYMSAGELARNGSLPGRVNVIGQILRTKYDGRNTTVTIRGDDNRNLTVVVMGEANNGYLELGSFYSFTGEILDSDTVVVSLPNSIKKQLGKVVTYTRSMIVKDGVAMYSHGYGTSFVAAPTVPNGTWNLKIVSVEGGNQEAMFP